MYLENRDFQVTIAEDRAYTMDNGPYDICWNPLELRQSDLLKAFSIQVEGKRNWSAVLIGTYLCGDDNCAVLDGDCLTVLLESGLVQIDLCRREMGPFQELPCSSNLFALYRCPEGIEGFVIWGEMEILKLDSKFRLKWRNSGADIFETPTGEPAFQMKQDRLCLRDFKGNYYEWSYSGETLRFAGAEAMGEGEKP